MMESVGQTISNLIKNQFPQHYLENGPLLVAFVENYYQWLEGRSDIRGDYYTDKTSTIKVQNRTPEIIGTGTFFTEQFVAGDKIAISRDEDDYQIFTVRSIANNTYLTLSSNNLPNFSLAKTRYGVVSEKPNSLFLIRNFFDIKDIDETFDEYVLYFKEKYLKNIQFTTITDTRQLIKHSLDLYRSKGTERAIDLLYKVVFGKPALVYYPGQDLFCLSSGDWFIPKYLELSLSQDNKKLIGKQIVGVLSGATAFVEEIIRRSAGGKIIEVAYISSIKGVFINSERITLPDNSLDLTIAPIIVGSLNELEVDIAGTGSSFEVGEVVDLTSTNGLGGIGKILTISNTVGALNYSLIDGGYGFSNTEQTSNLVGTVSVTTSCTEIVGTSTLFEVDLSVGDYLSVWSDSSSYVTRTVEEITSNTALTVNTGFGFTDAAAQPAYTRYFSQTYISEKSLKISNATINSTFSHFEYVRFLGSITQEVADLNYENSNGTFDVGDHIFTYHANNDLKGEGRILFLSRRTGTTGLLTISVLSGDLDEDAIYTEANAIGANLAVVNGYFDKTATASVIGNYSNVAVSCNNVVGTFEIGETINQVESDSEGILTDILFTSNTDIIINIANTSGIFRNGFSVIGEDSGAQATVNQVEFEVGVIDIVNQFFVYEGNYVYTDEIEGSVTLASLGSGVDVIFANTLLYTEEIEYVTDMIWPYLGYDLDVTWPFPAYPTANLNTIIDDAFTYANLVIGKIEAIIATNPGSDYTKAPIVRAHEPTVYSYDLPDTLLLIRVSTSSLQVGEVITQAHTGARGLIMGIDAEELRVQNLRFNEDDSFIVTTNVATQIIGSGSGGVSNIDSIIIKTNSTRLGSDITVSPRFASEGGSITSLKVIDSGFGFVNSELVTITSGDKEAQGFAVVETHGTGTGYYKSKDGFLSDDKKLSDGFYWQEYSYEVRSGVIDDFKDNLKNIIHVAGTKYFDALVYDTINTIESTVEQTQAFASSTQLRLRDDTSYLLLRNNTDKLILDHPH